jgi:hypothetical protein
MNVQTRVSILLLCCFSILNDVFSQTIPKEELIFLTSEWKGERFADGRPKIPETILERARHIMIDDAWTVLKNEGYLNQFDGVSAQQAGRREANKRQRGEAGKKGQYQFVADRYTHEGGSVCS